jgi:phosphoadenosine phosphosulfate reductase
VTAPASYRAIAERADAELAEATPHEVLTWAIETFHPRFAVTTSLADAVLIDMVSKIREGVPVIFIDTGYHFAETIGTRDAVAGQYPIRMLTAHPQQTRDEQDAEYGPRLYERNPDLCCALRKVAPLEMVLQPYVAWASGIRRDEAITRRQVRVVGWDERRSMVKVNPLAGWTQADVDGYIADRGVLVNPLVAAGYPSIGCAPCTRAVEAGADSRAGRWAGSTKIECGLHA